MNGVVTVPMYPEIPHGYGPNIHIINEPTIADVLAAASCKDTSMSTTIELVEQLYRFQLRWVELTRFPKAMVEVDTPMTKYVGDKARLKVLGLDRETLVTVAVLMRAGEIPSATVFKRLIKILKGEDKVRRDYFGAGRATNSDGHIIGTTVSYDKHNPLKGRRLLIPDPMGATGSTMVQIYSQYGEEMKAALDVIAMHLVITPEYVRRITRDCPDLQVFALRLDRGMSDQEAQDSVPGTFPEREFGLTPNGYIVPGMGDMGKRLTGAE